MTKSFEVHIEIEKGGDVKYEVDEESGKLKVDRFLHTSMVFPFNYGFIEDTKGEDGDPVDVVVLSSHPVHPGVEMKCHAIGLLQMEDEAGIDTKIIAVPEKDIDPEFGELTDVSDLHEALQDKISHFFQHYKGLEPGKWVKIGEFEGRKSAEELIKKASE